VDFQPPLNGYHLLYCETGVSVQEWNEAILRVVLAASIYPFETSGYKYCTGGTAEALPSQCHHGREQERWIHRRRQPFAEYILWGWYHSQQPPLANRLPPKSQLLERELPAALLDSPSQACRHEVAGRPAWRQNFLHLRLTLDSAFWSSAFDSGAFAALPAGVGDAPDAVDPAGAFVARTAGVGVGAVPAAVDPVAVRLGAFVAGAFVARPAGVGALVGLALAGLGADRDVSSLMSSPPPPPPPL
jgi:hypothetical protein